MVEKEGIMICIDNSKWMSFITNRHNYYLQLKCVRSYCRAKLKANPDNVIGIVTTGIEGVNNLLEPTSDLDKILNHLKCIWKVNSGDLNISGGLVASMTYLKCLHDPSTQKRILIFTGGF
ncbi:26S proteasome non-ATPase regulatory subunit 4 homolog isoform X2 [Rutidosis leptorrhynchoides]|uniref:26S proteasome non-ATPase regulatory subunit 4 homolog isoform X2 n=1 Tax=Rutidosis leptorrhynchoides TaxID=125765 RepID=UPI003A9A5D8C